MRILDLRLRLKHRRYFVLISVFSYEQAINFSNYGFAAAGAIASSVLGLAAVYGFTALLERKARTS